MDFIPMELELLPQTAVRAEFMNHIELRYHNNACLMCYSRENLTYCARCHNLAYCSTLHLNSRIHNTFCKAYVTCMKKSKNKKGTLSPNGYHIALQKDIELKLGKELEEFEVQMIFLAHECKKCMSNKNLTYCTKCKSVCFCTQCLEAPDSNVMAKHEPSCEHFLMRYWTDLFNTSYRITGIDWKPTRYPNPPKVLENNEQILRMVLPQRSMTKMKTEIGLVPVPQLMLYRCMDDAVIRWLCAGLNIINVLQLLHLNPKTLIIHLVCMVKDDAALPYALYTKMIKYFIGGIEKVHFYIPDYNYEIGDPTLHNGECVVQISPDPYPTSYLKFPKPNLTCFLSPHFQKIPDDILENNIKLAFEESGRAMLLTDYEALDIDHAKDILNRLYPSPQVQVVVDVQKNEYRERIPLRHHDYSEVAYRHEYMFLARKE